MFSGRLMGGGKCARSRSETQYCFTHVLSRFDDAFGCRGKVGGAAEGFWEVQGPWSAGIRVLWDTSHTCVVLYIKNIRITDNIPWILQEEPSVLSQSQCVFMAVYSCGANCRTFRGPLLNPQVQRYADMLVFFKRTLQFYQKCLFPHL